MSSRAARTSLARVSRRRRAPRPVGVVRGGTAVRCSDLTEEAIADTDDYVKTDEIIRCPAGGSSSRREVVDPAGSCNPAGSTAAIRYGIVVVVVVVVLVVVVV